MINKCLICNYIDADVNEEQQNKLIFFISFNNPINHEPIELNYNIMLLPFLCVVLFTYMII